MAKACDLGQSCFYVVSMENLLLLTTVPLSLVTRLRITDQASSIHFVRAIRNIHLHKLEYLTSARNNNFLNWEYLHIAMQSTMTRNVETYKVNYSSNCHPCYCPINCATCNDPSIGRKSSPLRGGKMDNVTRCVSQVHNSPIGPLKGGFRY